MLFPAWKNFVLLWKHCWFLSVVAFLLSSAVCLCLSSPPRTCQCNNYRHRIKYKVFAFHDCTQEIVILIILHLPPPHKCPCSNYRHRINYEVFVFHDSITRDCDSDYFAFESLRLCPILSPPHKCPCSNHRRRWRTSSCNCWFRTSGSLCTPCRCCSHLNENVWISSFWTKKKLADWSLFCLKVFYLHQVHRDKQQCSMCPPRGILWTARLVHLWIWFHFFLLGF